MASEAAPQRFAESMRERIPAEHVPRIILDGIMNDLFDVEVMSNLYRPIYVERMVLLGLGEGFMLDSANWSGSHESPHFSGLILA
jgi:hypothetical protein